MVYNIEHKMIEVSKMTYNICFEYYVLLTFVIDGPTRLRAVDNSDKDSVVDVMGCNFGKESAVDSNGNLATVS